MGFVTSHSAVSGFSETLNTICFQDGSKAAVLRGRTEAGRPLDAEGCFHVRRASPVVVTGPAR
jgi:hypothetical protein